MFWNILSIEKTKLVKRRMLWIELIILAILVLALYTLIYATLETHDPNAIDPASRQAVTQVVAWPGALIDVLSFGGGNSLGGMLLMILVGAATAQEYTWRTMHLWLSRGLPRPALLGAKAVSFLLPLVLFVLTPLIVGGALTAFFTVHIQGSLPLGQIDFWHLTLSTLRTAYTLLPYAALSFMLAILFRSTAAAIGISLAYTLLIEGVASTVFTLLGGTWQDIVMYLPGSLASGLLKLNRSGITAGVVSSDNNTILIKSLGPNLSALGIAIWTLVFLGLALWAFRRQDLSE